MKKKLLIVCLVAVVVFTVSVVALCLYWDVEAQKHVIEENLSAALNRPVLIGDVHLKVFPPVSVVLRQVAIRDCDAASVCLTVERVHIGVSLRQLFRRIVNFNTLTLEQPRVSLTRDESKRLNIDDLMRLLFPRKKIPRKGGISWVKEFRFFVQEAVVIDGSVTFKDYALSDAPFPVTVEGVYFRTGTFSYAEETPVTFECTFRHEEKKARIGFEGLAGPLSPKASLYTIPWKGTLEAGDIPLAAFRPYLAGWENVGSLQGQVDGAFSFDGTISGDFSASGLVKGKGLSIKRKDIFSDHMMLAEVQGKGTIKREGHTVTVPSLVLDMPGINAEVKGTFLTTEPWTMELEVKAEDLNCKDVISYLPVSRFSDPVKTALTERVRSGTVDSLVLHYAGTLVKLLQENGRALPGDVEGGVVFSDVSFVLADDMPRVDNLKGTITYTNKQLAFSDVTCTMGNCTLEQCRVVFSDKGLLRGVATADLDFGDIDRIVHSQSLHPRVKHELRRLNHIDGDGRINVEVSGPIENSGTLDINGELILSDAVIDFLDFRKVITGINGRITFDRSLLTIHPSRGFWAQSPITWYGEIPNYRSRKSEVRVHVTSEQARLEDLSPAFFPWMDNKKENVASVEVDFFCKGYRRKGFAFNGSTDFKNVSFSMPAFPLPFTEVQGDMTFSNEGLTFNGVRGKTGDSELVFSGAWRDFKQPVMTGKIEGTFVNLSDFLKPRGQKPSRSFQLDNVGLSVKEGRYKDLLVKDVSTYIDFFDGVFTFPSVRAGGGEFRGFEFEAVHNVRENSLHPVTFDKTTITIPFLSVRAGGGTWEGTDVRIPCRPESPERYRLTSTMSSFPVERIMQLFPPDRRTTLTGALDLEGSVEGDGKTFSEAVRNLEGSVDFSIRDGILKKAKILSKVFSLLNFSRVFSQDYSGLLDSGMHFTSINGSFQIDNGVLHTESILLDSAAMKIDALGDIDVGNRTVDMEIAVQPFETVDKVLDKIPILGTVLRGEEGALVVSYYKLEGPLGDPELDAVVFQSLGRKGQSIFKSIYNIPDSVLIAPTKSLWDKVRGNGEGEGETED